MTIKQFLKIHVEGYLFKDLRTMKRTKMKKGQIIGGVGYPFISSTLAGMEMLGGLLQKNTFAPVGMSTTYFNNYWDNFFIKSHPKYKDYGTAFRQLIRNGISHTYLTKTGIWIVRGNPTDHLRIFKNGSDYYLVVDIEEFFNDFISSYITQVRPIIYGSLTTTIVSKTEIEQRLKEMIDTYEKESNTVLSKIPNPSGAPLPPPNFWTPVSNVGASSIGTVTTYSGTRVKT